jgi:hypothetical protein
METFNMKYLRYATGLALLAGILALAGCRIPLSPEPPDSSSDTGPGLLTLTIGDTGSAARTVYPAESGFQSFVISFSHESRSYADEIFAPGDTISVALDTDAAPWTITVTAFTGAEGGGTATAGGTASVIMDGTAKAANITLTPISGGSAPGIFSYFISFPSSISSAALTITTTTGGAVSSGTITADSSQIRAGTLAGTLDLDAGYYLMNLNLVNNTLEVAGKTEVLYIYPALTTLADYAFTDDDFFPIITESNLDQMKSLIAAAADRGTKANPIMVKVAIADASLLSGTNSGGTDTLHKLYDAIPSDKYVGYDLSGCTFTSFGDVTSGIAVARINRVYLAYITLPDTLTGIGDYMFDGCAGLTSVTIPNSVTTIGSYAFYDCIGLTSVIIPESVTSIQSTTFGSCINLSVIQVHSDNAAYTSIDGVLFNKSGMKLITYPGGKEGSYIIPNSVTAIDSNAFGYCPGLTSVTIPESVTSIGSNAFASCTSLTSVTFVNITPPYFIGGEGTEAIFAGCSQLNVIHVPAGTLNTYRSALSSAGIDVSIISAQPDTEAAFSGLTADGSSSITTTKLILTFDKDITGLTAADITLTGAVKGTLTGKDAGVYELAVSGITAEGQVTVGVTKSGYAITPASRQVTVYYQFPIITESNLDQMKSLIAAAAAADRGTKANPIMVKVVIADASLLSGTNSGGTDTLHKLYDAIPSGKYVGYDLSGCTFTSFGDVTIDIAYARFNTGKTHYLAYITLPDTLTGICDSAFFYCTSLTSVTIPNSVTTIGSFAFYDCTGLTSVTIPNSVTSIGQSAFQYCTGLTSVTIPNSVTSIRDNAFYSCTGLTSISIPNSVASIGSLAFYLCTGLTSVTIPESVTSIDSNAFASCTGLTSVTFVSATPPSNIGTPAIFEDCSQLNVIHVPAGTLNAYRSALSSAGIDVSIISEPPIAQATATTTKPALTFDKDITGNDAFVS